MSGWRAVRLPNRFYPGLVRDEDAHTRGRLYHGLSHNEWSVLDAFEDSAYALTNIRISPERQALTYVWHEGHLNDAWSIDNLIAKDYQAYIDQCVAWRRRYRADGVS